MSFDVLGSWMVSFLEVSSKLELSTVGLLLWPLVLVLAFVESLLFAVLCVAGVGILLKKENGCYLLYSFFVKMITYFAVAAAFWYWDIIAIAASINSCTLWRVSILASTAWRKFPSIVLNSSSLRLDKFGGGVGTGGNGTIDENGGAKNGIPPFVRTWKCGKCVDVVDDLFAVEVEEVDDWAVVGGGGGGGGGNPAQNPGNWNGGGAKIKNIK